MVSHKANKFHLTSSKDALTAAKSAYFPTIINHPSHNPRTILSTVNTLLSPVLTSSPTLELCNSEKITTINTSLSPVSATAAPTLVPPSHHPS